MTGLDDEGKAVDEKGKIEIYSLFFVMGNTMV